jgi:polysaccharide pyruvyl transferase WcaK-like protein
MFGSSFVSVVNEKRRTDRYATNLKNLYYKIELAMPRDDVSFDNLHRLDANNLKLGCDPAFILDENETNVPKERKLGLFIGRRTKIKIKHIFEIIKYARNNKLKIEWIPWMVNRESFVWRSILNPRQATNLLLHIFLEFIFGNKNKYDGYLSSLTRYDIVVTDTYHLAINSVKGNVPVFCVCDGEELYKNSSSLFGHGEKRNIIFKELGFEGSCGEPTVHSMSQSVMYKYSGSDYKYHVGNCYNILKSICYSIINKGK